MPPLATNVVLSELVTDWKSKDIFSDDTAICLFLLFSKTCVLARFVFLNVFLADGESKSYQ